MAGISKLPASRRPKKIRFVRFVIFPPSAPQEPIAKALNGAEVTQWAAENVAKLFFVRFSDHNGSPQRRANLRGALGERRNIRKCGLIFPSDYVIGKPTTTPEFLSLSTPRLSISAFNDIQAGVGVSALREKEGLRL
jgi:hypothetical protein